MSIKTKILFLSKFSLVCCVGHISFPTSLPSLVTHAVSEDKLQKTTTMCLATDLCSVEQKNILAEILPLLRISAVRTLSFQCNSDNRVVCSSIIFLRSPNWQLFCESSCQFENFNHHGAKRGCSLEGCFGQTRTVPKNNLKCTDKNCFSAVLYNNSRQYILSNFKRLTVVCRHNCHTCIHLQGAITHVCIQPITCWDSDIQLFALFGTHQRGIAKLIDMTIVSAEAVSK